MQFPHLFSFSQCCLVGSNNFKKNFQKPFDALAVVVVRHQLSRKTTLIKALMGFQFNQVNRGKMQQYVALQMHYNPRCAHSCCFLQGDDRLERLKLLIEIQEYIEYENCWLEKYPMRSFDPHKINVRMEYKNFPNMILIDTPGVISAPLTRKDGLVNVQ